MGLPYELRGPVRAGGGMYIIVGAAFASDARRQDEARRLLVELALNGSQAGDPALAIRTLFARVSQGNDSGDRDLWSLMLLQWVLDERPASYLQQNQPLGQAWLQRVVPCDVRTLPDTERLLATLLPQKLIGNVQEALPAAYAARGTERSCVNVVPDHALVSAFEQDAERRLAALHFTQQSTERMARAFVFVAGFLPATGSARLLAIAYDLAMAYVHVLMEQRKYEEANAQGAGESGNSTAEDDPVAVYWSYAGFVIPFAMFVPYVRGAFLGLGVSGLAWEALSMVVDLWEAIITAGERVLAAAEEKFSDWHEFDVETGWLIPFDD